MAEHDFPPERQQPSPEWAAILAQGRQQWRRFRAGPIVDLVGLVGALLFVWSSWFTVQPEETGIVQRFGKVVRSAGPGLHFKWPYGVETVRLVPTARVLTEEFGFRTLASVPGQRTQYMGNQNYEVESLMLTGDLNVIMSSGSSSTASKTRSATSFRCATRQDGCATSPRRHAPGGREPARQRCAHRRPGGGL
jgi:membrane protease subunit HflK